MFAVQRIAYNQTNAFTKIVLDYLKESEDLRPFYGQSPTRAGIEETILKKHGQPVNREMLVRVLREQYQSVEATP